MKNARKLGRSMRRFASAAGGLCLAALMTTPSPAADRTVIVSDIPGIGNLLVKVAAEKGFCEKQNLTCRIRSIPAIPLAVQAMMAKDIDAVMAPVDVIISAIKNGTPMKMTAGALLTNQNLLVASERMAAPNKDKPWPGYMPDFVGKKVGVTVRGASTEIAFRYLMLKAGLDPNAVTYVAVGGAVTGYNALVSGQVDALMIAEPLGGICTETKACRVVWRAMTDREPAGSFGLNGSALTIVFPQATIAANPALVDALIAALHDAEVYTNDPKNFDEVFAVSQKYFKLEFANGDAITRANLKLLLDNGTYRVAIDRNSVRKTIDFLVENKILDAPLPVDQLVYEKAP